MQKDVSFLEIWRQGEDVPRYDHDATVDAWRIENWYAQHGYINAKLLVGLFIQSHNDFGVDMSVW